MRRIQETQAKINSSILLFLALAQNSTEQNTISPIQIMRARLQEMNRNQCIPSRQFSSKNNHQGHEPSHRNNRGYKS